MASILKLYYGNSEIGTIRNSFCSDNTWYGMFELGVSGQDGELGRHISQYVKFVEDWNERVHRNEPADPSEFDQYPNFADSKLWSTRDEQGNVTHITDGPVFFVGGELSWRID